MEEEEGAVTCAAMGRDMGTGGLEQRRTADGEEEGRGAGEEEVEERRTTRTATQRGWKGTAAAHDRRQTGVRLR